MANRGYSRKKCLDVIASQKEDGWYRERADFVLLNQQDKRMKFQSLFADNFIKNFEDTQFMTIPTDTSFVKAQILKKSVLDKSISARKETVESIGKITELMESIK